MKRERTGMELEETKLRLGMRCMKIQAIISVKLTLTEEASSLSGFHSGMRQLRPIQSNPDFYGVWFELVWRCFTVCLTSSVN